jgi:hypothetical protein
MAQLLPLFDRFAPLLRNLPDRDLTDDELTPFQLACEETLRVVYAPFDWLNLSAVVVICGITPGRNSMMLALRTSASALRDGASHEDAACKGKRTGSFSNMRKNLVTRMDGIGLHTVLGLDSTARLFAERADLLHTTSTIRYPVFKDGKNYGGYSPDMVRHPLLRRFIDEYLKLEVQSFPRALFVPNGPAVAKALLAAGVEESRCLIGFPHCSNGPGAKARIATFERERDQMRRKVANWRADVPYFQPH